MRLTGKVHSLNHEKLFGFIHVGRDRQGYFFHQNETPLFGQLRVGDPVTFEPQESERGPRATEIAA